MATKNNMGAFIDRLGKRYGRLLVIGLASKTDNRKRRFWNCRCDCGTSVVVLGDNLSGNTKSCGCFQRDRATESHATHDGCGTPEYSTWCNMKNRCSNPTLAQYKDYGGRGISVCKRWRTSFENFLADMGERPGSDFTIERVDVNGNYEPSNCIWLHRTEQNKNKRSTQNHISL